MHSTVGFATEEVDTASPTRAARLKWVVVVNETLASGIAANAAVCVAAATASGVAGLLGPDGVDADGHPHPGLPWAGCTVLSASAEQLRALRAAAASSEGEFVADMPAAAQSTRVYDEYLGELAGTAADDVEYYAVSIVGPRNRVDRLVRKLPLL